MEIKTIVRADSDTKYSLVVRTILETPKLRGTPRGTSRSRATPKGTPRGTPRGTTRGTPKGAVDGGVAKVTKYKEAGCQTSPGFVSKVSLTLSGPRFFRYRKDWGIPPENV